MTGDLGQDKIMKLLEKKGFDISSQAAKFLDFLGRDKDQELVNEFVKWYEEKYKKVISGGDVINFITNRKK